MKSECIQIHTCWKKNLSKNSWIYNNYFFWPIRWFCFINYCCLFLELFSFFHPSICSKNLILVVILINIFFPVKCFDLFLNFITHWFFRCNKTLFESFYLPISCCKQFFLYMSQNFCETITENCTSMRYSIASALYTWFHIGLFDEQHEKMLMMMKKCVNKIFEWVHTISIDLSV